MSEKFYRWLCHKYGWGKEQYEEIERDDPDFADLLLAEYSGIAASYS